MPITANAKKALRQQNARATRNGAIRSEVRTMIKKVKKQPTAEVLSELYSVVDTAVKRHVLVKNKAARIKSQAVAESRSTEPKAVVKKAPKAAAKRKLVAAKKAKAAKKK